MFLSLRFMRARALSLLAGLAFFSGCAAEPGGTPPPDAGAVELLEPMEAPAETWTYVPFLRTRCMSGGPAGLGINLSPDSDRLLIYLQEGGACWDSLSCLMTLNVDGFSQGDFDAFIGRRGRQGHFNRDDPSNPFADWNHVFVPYCSGDVHGGANPEGPGGRIHMGARNMERFLERILLTFPHVRQVVLAGSSAGGVGAALNFDRVQRAFGEVPVLLLDDSGPVMSDTYLRPCLQQVWREAWNLDESLPEDCEACREGPGGLSEAFRFVARKYPDRRMGLILSNRDSVFRSFFGFGAGECTTWQTMDGETFNEGALELRDTLLADHPNVRIYMLNSEHHVWLWQTPMSRLVNAGVPLSTWIQQLVDGDPGWDHVGP